MNDLVFFLIHFFSAVLAATLHRIIERLGVFSITRLWPVYGNWEPFGNRFFGHGLPKNRHFWCFQ